VGTIVTEFGGLVCGGLDVTRQHEAHMFSVVGSPRSKLESILRSRRIRITKHGIDTQTVVTEHCHGFIRGRGFDHNIATASEVVGDRMADEHVAIDN
jgi:hypothetical protein